MEKSICKIFDNIVLNKEHICPICLSILNDPLECSVCKKEFCTICVSNYKSCSLCPFGCKKSILQPIGIRQVFLKCEKCKEQCNFNEFSKHKCSKCIACGNKVS